MPKTMTASRVTALIPHSGSDQRQNRGREEFHGIGTGRELAERRWIQLNVKGHRRRRINKVERDQLSSLSGVLMPTPVRSDSLWTVRFVRPSTILLQFEDGFKAKLPVSRLEIPVSLIQWNTVKVSPAGEAMTVTGTNGDTVPIDSSTLRYLVDPIYAAKISKALDEAQLTRDEMRQLSEPPAGWTGDPEN